jgi:hypothetical protein
MIAHWSFSVSKSRFRVVTQFEFALEPFRNFHRKAAVNATTPTINPPQPGKLTAMNDPQPRVCQFDGFGHIIATDIMLDTITATKKAVVPARILFR